MSRRKADIIDTKTFSYTVTLSQIVGKQNCEQLLIRTIKIVL